MRASLSILIVTAICACDSGDPTGTSADPLSGEEALAACGDVCDYRASCGDDEAACLAWCGVLADVVRADAARILVACYVEQACDLSSESGCLAEAIDSVEPSAAYDEARASCEVVERRCDLPYGCANTYYGFLADPILRDLTGCFALGCDVIEACVDDVVDGG